MKTNEVEKLLGITKHTLRYYEKEDLVHPIKDDNGYRNYSDEDIQTLELIKFLRNLEISIDDIKGIINGDITFKECLEVNKIYLDQKTDALTSIKHTVDNYVKKNIPLIPALASLEIIEPKKGLGYRKYNNEVTLGKKPSKKSVLTKWLISTFLSFIPINIWLMFVNSYTRNPVYLFLFFLIPAAFIHLSIFGSNTHMANLENSSDQSIEFLSEGIRYYKRTGLIKHALYLYSYLFNKQDKYLRHIKYSDIKNVTLKKQKRYIAVGTPIASQVDIVDFTFEFNNGGYFYFYWPSTYDNDMQYIMIILKEMIKNINDDDHILDKCM